MKYRLSLGILFLPAALHAQSSFFDQSSVTAGIYKLPFNERIDFASDSDGGSGITQTESSASTTRGEVKGTSRSDLSKSVLQVSNSLVAPEAGQRHYVSSTTNMSDTLTFERPGKDISVPMRFTLDGFLQGGDQRATGDFTIFDAVSHVPVFRLLLDTRGDRWQDEAIWTIPANSSGIYNFSLQLGSTAQSDYPGDAASSNLLAQLRWDLPGNVSYTSASGVFGAERINPVPEPATVAGLALGLVAVKRRRKGR